MVYSPPSSVQGAKKAISARIRDLPLAKSEPRREELKDEISKIVAYLYKYTKVGEQAEKNIERR